MKANKVLILMIIFLLLVILTGAGLFIFQNKYVKNKSHLGTWQRDVDMTPYVVASMNEWFSDPTTSSRVNFGTGKVYVKTDLVFSDDGNFTEKINPESYEAAKSVAKEIALEGLRSFLEIRLESAGASAEDVGKTVDELIEEALEMTAAEYLDQKGPALLPTIDELGAIYGQSGTYEVKDGIMKRTISGKSICESYFTKDDYLMFTGTAEDIFEKQIAQPMGGDDTPLEMLYDYPALYRKK